MNAGIYQISMMEYLALDALSSGVAHTVMSASPMHARFEQRNERVASSEMDVGTYAHAMLLEGGTDALVVIDAEDWRTKAAKEQRDIARAEGKLPILARKLPEVEAMVKSAREYLGTTEMHDVFMAGAAEQTIIWQEGDILCKARPDWLSDKHLMHVKTTATSVHPNSFSRTVASCGYDFSLAFYLRGLAAVKPDADPNHFILAIEQTAPYACKLFDLTAARQDVAERQVERAIGQWARCLASGKFPAYDGSVHSIDLQPWELAQAEEDMLTDDELGGGIPA